MTLTEALEKSGLTLAEAGAMVNLGKSAISRIKAHDYPNWEQAEALVIEKMAENGMLGDDYVAPQRKRGTLKVDSVAFIRTQNVNAVNTLAEDLLDDNTTLNASIGLVTGSAGFGKTTTMKQFVATHDRATYVPFLQGFTLNMLCKAISREMIGSCQGTFERNLQQIQAASKMYRRLVIIDEADLMPLRLVEALRNINEYCDLPIMLVGEDSLVSKMESLPRLKSRVRKPEIVFLPLNTVDVATYYQAAIGLDISRNPKICQTLLRWANKDFRILVNDAQHICQVMNASGVSELTEEVLNAYKLRRA